MCWELVIFLNSSGVLIRGIGWSMHWRYYNSWDGPCTGGIIIVLMIVLVRRVVGRKHYGKDIVSLYYVLLYKTSEVC